MTAYLNALGLVCALGRGQADVARRLFAGDCSGMRVEDGWVPQRGLPVAAVQDELPSLPAALQAHHSRNNQLLYVACLQIGAAIEAAIARFGRQRIGIVLGTSTSGIKEASDSIAHYLREQQFPPSYDYAQQELSAPANFLADWLQLSGPAYVISTACTSSARALMSARRLLDLGVCDAVICGGVDSLCKLTLNGFTALEAVSAERCNPFSVNRNGINIGEAAALFLMTREANHEGASIALLGAGASSDAHHISAPEPSGKGALQAMRKALDNARLQPAQIDYLNLHGTATRHNDAMESLAVHELFGSQLACSSSKPMTGHTLGAAGALEAAFCWLSLAADNTEGRLPPHVWDGVDDPQLPALNLVDASQRLPAQGPRRLMSNSFAFGGNNVSLILGDTP
ncbi:beta-ketoacyl-[acyl-carrier-protein] synthase family protein [Pseudomonas donghuensis]|uniref:Beta-ketoacyl-[acyl-carrier-protein] synthase family protein n=1 Tax=Pseudomonas donghuensis TaxID=1163398 RepID=A0AAP0XAQ2_9PSED|nr:beta-ketoacyl-[acyl-carrier-protein] synthase family protein [Pseudomonas donghuensis]MDF9891222.1 3-oxoacyl-[acyl-carrier-protein] synthase-1 [Pseudomonas vranovensis]KDN99369.1 beta-ketoacyl-[acyl-carrier-protein] synthase family protein [Pseudomonas donghuensis]MCP6693229.1 beta-ketoacyl-[acyl-carrier-protein] synthase family protein [Pseudomonas donghuensis]PJY95750.1 beta-ketoacyl-[acyl-carrier-protein] synthase II [Pseudomonas donghuensis]WKY28686.1 beta-ketoacyl-[acyl-carrier-protein